MIGRRGFFGALAACFSWILPFRRAEAKTEQVRPGTEEIGGKIGGNIVFGFDSDVAPGVENAVVMGQRSRAKKSNVVVLGNEKTEALIVGAWEFGADESGPYFVNHVTHEKYRLRLENPPLGNAAPGYPAFGQHALICGGPECPVGSHPNQAFGPGALR